MKTLPFRRNRALTLSEVLVLLAGLAILAALMLSGPVHDTPGRASQINCVSNLCDLTDDNGSIHFLVLK